MAQNIGTINAAASNVARWGPFKSSAGNFYVIGHAGATLYVRKCTDPGTAAWTTAASLTVSNYQTGTNEKNGIDVVQSGDTLHIAQSHAHSTSTSAWQVKYHVFSMSSDSFTTSNEIVLTSANGGWNFSEAPGSAYIVLRSGNPIILYSADMETLHGKTWHRIAYAIKSGSWSVGNAIYSGAPGQRHLIPTGLLIDSDGRTHFFWGETTSNTAAPLSISHRALNSSDGFGAQSTMFADSAAERPLGAGAVIGTTLYAPYVERTSLDLRVLKFTVADSPTITTELATGETDDGRFVAFSFQDNNAAVVVDVDGTPTIAFIANADDDLYYAQRGASWGNKSLIEAFAETDRTISANVYDRGGETTIGVVYIDEAGADYVEKRFGAPPGPSAGLRTLALTGVGT